MGLGLELIYLVKIFSVREWDRVRILVVRLEEVGQEGISVHLNRTRIHNQYQLQYSV